MKRDNGVKVLFRGALYVYDDLKEKTKKYEEENFVNVWSKICL